ncbi:hypothetical protein RAX54_004611 [Vibrio parahaemolyticus]|nr:hypothetical protein [Vibrio parahaemolyticus]
MNWLDFIPTLLSAIASIGAAIAAFISLRISKQSQSISQLTALASHQASATTTYVDVVKELNNVSSTLQDISYEMWYQWGREIEAHDNYSQGGNDPRPLRHVLSNGSEMLSNYARNHSRWGRSTSNAILSPIRFGINNFSEIEYLRLLKKADGAYFDFESVFGKPNSNEPIGDSLAFRWVCYQLNKRVSKAEWKQVWDKAWEKGDWLDKYKSEYVIVKSTFEKAKEKLELEKAKLSPSALPLTTNPSLYRKYCQALKVIEHVIDDADIDKFSPYKEWRFHEDISQLVLCVMATSFCLHSHLDELYSLANE